MMVMMIMMVMIGIMRKNNEDDSGVGDDVTVKMILIRVAQPPGALEPGCEEMERE